MSGVSKTSDAEDAANIKVDADDVGCKTKPEESKGRNAESSAVRKDRDNRMVQFAAG
jgi:hypothetical protein